MIGALLFFFAFTALFTNSTIASEDPTALVREAMGVCENEARHLSGEDEPLRPRVRRTMLRLSSIASKARAASPDAEAKKALTVAEQQASAEILLSYAENEYSGARYFVTLRSLWSTFALAMRGAAAPALEAVPSSWPNP